MLIAYTQHSKIIAYRWGTFNPERYGYCQRIDTTPIKHDIQAQIKRKLSMINSQLNLPVY